MTKKRKLSGLREVDWNLPPGDIIADKRGKILDSSLYSCLDTFGYNIGEFENVGHMISELGADIEGLDKFLNTYKLVAKGKKESSSAEFDMNFSGYHCHLTLSYMKGEKIAIHFGDQTTATLEKRAAELKLEETSDLLHYMKNLATHFGLFGRVKKKVETGDIKTASLYMDTLENAVMDMEEAIMTYHQINSVESGKIPLDKKYISFKNNVVEPVLSIVDPKIVQKGGSIDRKLSSKEANNMIFADERRMKYVLFHIVNNALDHGEDGLTLAFGSKPVIDGNREIGQELHCWNSRSYITPKDRDYVFERYFTTGGKSGTGTGIGMHNVWKIVVDEHKGKIDIDTQPGKDDKEPYTDIIITLYNEDYLREHVKS